MLPTEQTKGIMRNVNIMVWACILACIITTAAIGIAAYAVIKTHPVTNNHKYMTTDEVVAAIEAAKDELRKEFEARLAGGAPLTEAPKLEIPKAEDIAAEVHNKLEADFGTRIGTIETSVQTLSEKVENFGKETPDAGSETPSNSSETSEAGASTGAEAEKPAEELNTMRG